MDPDLVFVTGIVLALLSVPAALSALSENRRPRVAALAAIAAGGLIVWALQARPGGYGFGDIPDVFVRVLARYLG